MEAKLAQADKSSWPLNEKLVISDELNKAYNIRDSSIMQKARLNWDLKGETNSKFFHNYVKYRARRKTIHGIVNNNVWISEPEDIKNHFLNFFKAIFNPKGRILRVNLEVLNSTKLEPHESEDLSKLFAINEVELALKSLDSSIAPSLDGLNGAFIKETWYYLTYEFMAMMEAFHENGSLPRGMNSSFINLIPKTKTPTSAGDYRPISLINFTMKILLKALENRLSRYIGILVFEN